MGGEVPNGTMTYAEYFGSELSVSNIDYLMTVIYASDYSPEGRGSAYLGEYGRPGGLLMARELLSDSAGQWRVLHALMAGPDAQTTMKSFFRVFGLGDLRVWAFDIKPVFVIDQ